MPTFVAMEHRDHLMAQFERMAAALARLIAALHPEGPTAMVEIRAVEEEIAQLLCADPDELIRLAPEELLKRLEERTGWDEGAKDRLADALMALAEAHSTEAHAAAYRWQALAVLYHLNRTSTSYSMERRAKAAELRARLS